VEVATGVLRDDCERANAQFFRFITAGRPYVVLKAAATADGKIATATGDSRWVTGPEARALVHRWRDQFDAVLVGSGTIVADDPRLTARVRSGARPPRDPLRVVLCSRLRLSPRARVVTERSTAPTLVATTPRHSRARAAALRRRGVEVLVCSAKAGRVDLADLLRRLAARGIVSVLVEGGARVFRSFLDAGLADEVRLFIAPKVLGGGISWADTARPPRHMDGALALHDVRVDRAGDDVLITARPLRRR
jgi:diaminohydroxyphosphoribosylaminopyrimidine deaminase/5-amino-6-(5-phosphoribosylamino)uracil reductase